MISQSALIRSPRCNAMMPNASAPTTDIPTQRRSRVPRMSVARAPPATDCYCGWFVMKNATNLCGRAAPSADACFGCLIKAAPLTFLLPAPLPNRCDFHRRNVEVLQKFIVVLGRSLFELAMPTAHVVFAETRSLHNRNPFVFRHVLSSPQDVFALQQPQNHVLVFPQSADLRIQLPQSTS